MDACFFCCVNFSVISPVIDWEERLRNDVFCVGWDVKPWLSQSVLTPWCAVVGYREVDQVVFPDSAQEYPGQRAEGDHALSGQLRQG